MTVFIPPVAYHLERMGNEETTKRSILAIYILHYSQYSCLLSDFFYGNLHWHYPLGQVPMLLVLVYTKTYQFSTISQKIYIVLME
ncbi:hypothetical protein DP73_03050 [Desulfosporosinus sp. HMP52]|nr:hypothetical protein DP73_03050 [Desulfosporosinus sp. HMP52]